MPRKYKVKSNKTPVKEYNKLPVKESVDNSIAGNILAGLTFGAGSSLGHRAIDGVMGRN